MGFPVFIFQKVDSNCRECFTLVNTTLQSEYAARSAYYLRVTFINRQRIVLLTSKAVRTAPVRGLLFAIHTGVRNFQTISI